MHAGYGRLQTHSQGMKYFLFIHCYNSFTNALCQHYLPCYILQSEEPHKQFWWTLQEDGRLRTLFTGYALMWLWWIWLDVAVITPSFSEPLFTRQTKFGTHTISIVVINQFMFSSKHFVVLEESYTTSE